MLYLEKGVLIGWIKDYVELLISQTFISISWQQLGKNSVIKDALSDKLAANLR